MKRFISEFVNDDQGQSTTEYILILSVVVMVALNFKSRFQKLLNKMIGDLDSKLSGGMQDDG